jgi:5-methyltetrahydropteroyltriglutamate--homocysteine methyltransferase
MREPIPFETSVVGSLPRPQWVRDVVAQGDSGELSPENLQKLGDLAVGFAIGLQEAAGVDVITDGEWRRMSYTTIIAQRVPRFEPIDGRPDHFRVAERIRRVAPILVDDLQFLRQNASREVKITLPAPYHLSNHRGFAVPADVYANREEFLADLVEVIAEEAADLADCGADVIQFDDPRVLALTLSDVKIDLFPRGRGSLESEMRLVAESLRRVTGRTGDARTALHVCRGNINRTMQGVGGYENLMPFLPDLPCDQILMEFAIPEAGDMAVLNDFPADKRLGLGVVDVRCETVDRVEMIMSRAEGALKYVDPDRISLNPDCGFAPGMNNPIPLDEAYLKLVNQTQAARQLRDRFL